MSEITLCLPIPVSLNKAYNNSKKGRVKTSDARAWYHEAMHFAVPFIKHYQRICDQNILTRRRYMTRAKTYGGQPGVKLQALKSDHPHLAYAVSYTFNFPNDTIRDVFNFEKLLTDLLVECGFMLDDNFILDGRVRWGKLNPTAPHVEIEIISLDRQEALGYNISTQGNQTTNQKELA